MDLYGLDENDCIDGSRLKNTAFLAGGLTNGSNIPINKELSWHEPLPDPESKHKDFGFDSHFYPKGMFDVPCNYLVVFFYKNRFGKKYHTVYRLTTGDNFHTRTSWLLKPGNLNIGESYEITDVDSRTFNNIQLQKELKPEVNADHKGILL